MIIDHGPSFPHLVPRVVVPFVVQQGPVLHRSGGAEGEVVPGPPVMVWIDVELEPVGGQTDVTASEDAHNGIGRRILHSGCKIAAAMRRFDACSVA